MDWRKIHPAKREGIIFRDLGGETLILSTDDKVKDKEVIIILNTTGTSIWNLIDGKNTARDIINLLCEQFEVDHDTAEKEVIQFLAELKQKNLIRSR